MENDGERWMGREELQTFRAREAREFIAVKNSGSECSL
jgi:hypothetical protein